MRRLIHGIVLLLSGAALVAGLAACATGTFGAGTATPSQTPTPTPLYACPEQPGVELPPECAPYDPDAAMAQNDRYRERMEMDAADQAANQELVDALTAALEGLDRAALSEDAVRSAILEVGAADVQLRGDARAYLFGAIVPGGCVYGSVEQTAVTVELGGFILDGGCLPAQ